MQGRESFRRTCFTRPLHVFPPRCPSTSFLHVVHVRPDPSPPRRSEHSQADPRLLAVCHRDPGRVGRRRAGPAHVQGIERIGDSGGGPIRQGRRDVSHRLPRRRGPPRERALRGASGRLPRRRPALGRRDRDPPGGDGGASQRARARASARHVSGRAVALAPGSAGARAAAPLHAPERHEPGRCPGRVRDTARRRPRDAARRVDRGTMRRARGRRDRDRRQRHRPR